MNMDPKAVPGILDADGLTIRLASKIALPPGEVSVVVSLGSPSAPPPRAKLPAGLLTSRGEPTARYAAYLKYQAKYTKAKQAYDEAYSAALADPLQLQMWPLRGAEFQAAVDAALHEWVSLGFKNDIDRQLAGGK